MEDRQLPSFRWKICVLMFFGILINYLDRVNISHTILMMSQEFGLSPMQQGIILSSFSWGYVLFMLPSGWLIDRFGPRIVSAVACAAWSVATAMLGIFGSFASFVACRLLLGAAEAPIFPANAKVVRTWFPLQERGRATAIFDVGSYVGAAASAPFVISVMMMWGWRVSFFACAATGLIWSAVWYIYYRNPNDNSSDNSAVVTDTPIEESNLLQVSWPLLFSSRKIWGMAFGFFCYNYLKSFFLTWFPSYLVVERGFTIIKVGIYSLIPPLCAVLSELLAGAITDKLISRGVSVTLARKIPLCVGLIISSTIIGAAYIDSEASIIVLLSFSYAGLIAASASIWAIPGDVAPHVGLVGSIGSIQNTFSNIAGIIAPMITGAIYGATGSFAIPLFISGVLIFLGAASYWFLVGELEPIGQNSFD